MNASKVRIAWVCIVGFSGACTYDWSVAKGDLDASSPVASDGEAVDRGDSHVVGNEGADGASDVWLDAGLSDSALDSTDQSSGDASSGPIACLPGFEVDGADGCRQIDDCKDTPCAHGAICTDELLGYRCACAGTGREGPKCEVDTDECLTASTCSEAYPCVNKPGSYYCRSRIPQWPVSDSVAGARTSTSLSNEGDRVVDLVTGLVWQRQVPAIYPGCTGNVGAVADTCSQQEASKYCQDLVLGASDWRLPSKIELESMVDHTWTEPAVDPAYFPGVPLVSFWSSSGNPGVSLSYAVDFRFGTTDPKGATSPHKVRCVRAGQTGSEISPTDRFLAAGTDEVQDQATGLTWQRTMSPDKKTWAEAKATCTGSWRLPTAKELLSLVDPVSSKPLNDAFPLPVGADYYMWSSTPDPRLVGIYAWGVYLATGASFMQDATIMYNVRCVR